MSDVYGISLQEARNESAKLRLATSTGEGGLPKLVQADDQASAGISDLLRGSGNFETGLSSILTARQQHVEQAMDTVRTTLNNLPAAMKGDPAAALEHTLTTWNGGVDKVKADLAEIEAIGTRLKTVVDDARADFQKVLTKLQEIEPILKNMVASLGTTQTALDRHIGEAEAVITSGTRSMGGITG